LLLAASPRLLAVLQFVLWSWIVLWVRWDGESPSTGSCVGKADRAGAGHLTLLALHGRGGWPLCRF
jgi:hypothetical protein